MKKYINKALDAIWGSLNRKTKILLIIGIALRLVITVIALAKGLYTVGDTESYLVPARSFLETGKLFVDGHADLCRTPVYPLFLSFCLLFSEKAMPVIAVIIQQLLGLAVFYVWRKWIADFIPSEKIRTALEAIYLFNVVSIYYACLLITDFLFQLGLIIMCYLLHLFWNGHKIRYAVSSGITLGLLILLRPVAMYLPFALFIGIVFVGLISKTDRKKILLSSIAFILCSSSLAGAWACRNFAYTGEFTVSNIADINLYAYNVPAIEAELTGRTYYEIHEERLNEGLSEEGLAKAKQLISENKLLYAKKYAIGIGMQFIYPGINDVAKSVPQIDEGIQRIKSELTSSNGLVEKGLNCIKYCFTDNIAFLIFAILLIIDVFILLALTIFFLCFVFSRKYNTAWYEKWMLIGIIAYFVICCAAPVGYGAYPRFRVAFLYPALLGAGNFISTIKRKAGTD